MHMGGATSGLMAFLYLWQVYCQEPCTRTAHARDTKSDAGAPSLMGDMELDRNTKSEKIVALTRLSQGRFQSASCPGKPVYITHNPGCLQVKRQNGEWRMARVTLYPIGQRSVKLIVSPKPDEPR
ncbi:hypothetical protein BC826DRAFT_434800 [Russula brevipes]|nr:hypothetical protein BC826DRAFT_434800 [Russula brevipes]